MPNHIRCDQDLYRSLDTAPLPALPDEGSHHYILMTVKADKTINLISFLSVWIAIVLMESFNKINQHFDGLSPQGGEVSVHVFYPRPLR